jgi:GT2 family glycosyltransferase
MSETSDPAHQATRPLITVIVPTCNRGEQLGDCLMRLAPGAQTLAPERYEVIVTDDSQANPARELISQRFPWAKWVQGRGRGPATNRNNGAKSARGSWLVFIDDDCLPEPDLLSLYAKNTGGEALALEGAIHPLGDAGQDMVECPVNTTGGYFWSANIAVQRALFESLGGFDPDYPMAAHEDQDLHFRLCQRTQVKFLPDARVFHRVRKIALADALRRIPARTWAWAIHVSKHRKDLGYESNGKVFWKESLLQLRIAARNLRRGKWKTAAYYFAWLIVGVPMTIRFLRKIDRKGIGGSLRSRREEAPF